MIVAAVLVIAIFSAIKPLPTITVTAASSASPTIDVGATGTAIWYDENPLALSPLEATETAIWYTKNPQAGATETADYYKKYYPSLTILPTDTPGPPTATPTMTATPLARGERPPACTFPLAQITPVESKPETYTFSQPKIMLNAEQGNLYVSFGWLPDNQQIFIKEDLRQNQNDIKQTISLYTPATGKRKVYAKVALKITEPLGWAAGSNAVVYPAIRFFDIDRKKGTYKLDRQIRIGYGKETDQNQILVHNLSELVLAVKPDGSTLIYLTDKKILGWDQSLKTIPAVPFDLAQWDYATERRGNQPVFYKTAWQPNSSKVFLYSSGYSGGGGYTFILDTANGNICELNLGEWSRSAHWSSDGRYLALDISATYGYINNFPAAMIVLDTFTGKQIMVYFISEEKKDRFSVIDFAWAPDNRHLLAIGYDSKFIAKLYLTDFVSGQSISVLPGNNLYAKSPDTLQWSLDGSKLVYRCPTQLIDRICFISVQKTRK